ncbi:HNH endonuclease [Cupriavidus pinatubonensis]|nr:HNH endonuclease [Cupriavidus pinatubonensis]
MAATKGHGNPDWTRDETILALDLYLRCEGSMPGPNDPRVIALSQELRSLPIHPVAKRRDSFRNPEGVAFKLQNLRQVATGRGLANVSIVDRDVWGDFGNRPEFVEILAGRIRGESAASAKFEPFEQEDEEFAEGRLLTRAHRRRERERSIRAKLINQRLSAMNGLACDACGEGPRISATGLCDAGFEAHHTLPLARAGESGTTTRLRDMALLCATCHRLLHRVMQTRKEWVSIADFKSLLTNGR